jgi:hypothetical protein
VQLFRHACFAAAAAGEIVWRDIDGALASRQGNGSLSLFARVVPLCHFPLFAGALSLHAVSGITIHQSN